jgi:hypothetical protein
MTPLQIRESLAQLAAGVISDEKVRDFKEQLALKGSPNGGTAVSDDLKYTSRRTAAPQRCDRADTVITVKYSRALGIHVSPTVLLDGIEVKQASSSWGEAEWTDFLKSSVTV